MKVKQCGVFICAQYPYLAASPDAIVTCDCCGERPLEVKNPFKYRHMSIQNYAEQRDSCLEVQSDGTVVVKYNHPYYTPVQLQMLATESDVGYFCVKTACLGSNLHCQEVFMGNNLLEEAVAKADVFFKKVIVPELLTGNIKKIMESATTCASQTSASHDMYWEESEETICCGVCASQCPEEPKEFNEMSIGCDRCNKWFHWQCVNVTGNESFILDNLTWVCHNCQESNHINKY